MGREEGEAVGVGFDEAAEAVVFVVVVAVLDVVPPEDFDFAEVGRLFPLPGVCVLVKIRIGTLGR